MNAEREASLAWDRVGLFLQQTGTVATEVADRHVRLWSSVSGHLKQGPYTADAMADDLARSISTAMNNLSSIWSLFAGSPAQNTVARPVPTAFLLFDWAGTSQHRLLDPVRIDVGSLAGRGGLPARALVEVSGTRAPVSDEEHTRSVKSGKEPATSVEGAQRLRDRLVASWDKRSGAYILSNVNRHVDIPDPASATGATRSIEDGLVPGVYEGVVYLIDPPALLASIRILVESPPPEPPIVSDEAEHAVPEDV